MASKGRVYLNHASQTDSELICTSLIPPVTIQRNFDPAPLHNASYFAASRSFSSLCIVIFLAVSSLNFSAAFLRIKGGDWFKGK